MKTGVITFKAGIMLLGGTNHGGKLKGDVSGWRGYIEPRTAKDFTSEIKARLGGGEPIRLDVHEVEYPALEEAVFKSGREIRLGLGTFRHIYPALAKADFIRAVVYPAGWRPTERKKTMSVAFSQDELARKVENDGYDYMVLENLTSELKKLYRYSGIGRAMASRWLVQAKRLNDVSLDVHSLSQEEHGWLELRITVLGNRKKDNRLIFLSAAEIARRMKVNRKYINRMEARLEARKDIQDILRLAGARPRKPRGAACPKRDGFTEG